MNIEEYPKLPYTREMVREPMDLTSSLSRSFLDACPAVTRRRRPFR